MISLRKSIEGKGFGLSLLVMAEVIVSILMMLVTVFGYCICFRTYSNASVISTVRLALVFILGFVTCILIGIILVLKVGMDNNWCIDKKYFNRLMNMIIAIVYVYCILSVGYCLLAIRYHGAYSIIYAAGIFVQGNYSLIVIYAFDKRYKLGMYRQNN